MRDVGANIRYHETDARRVPMVSFAKIFEKKPYPRLSLARRMQECSERRRSVTVAAAPRRSLGILRHMSASDSCQRRAEPCSPRSRAQGHCKHPALQGSKFGPPKRSTRSRDRHAGCGSNPLGHIDPGLFYRVVLLVCVVCLPLGRTLSSRCLAEEAIDSARIQRGPITAGILALEILAQFDVWQG